MSTITLNSLATRFAGRFGLDTHLKSIMPPVPAPPAMPKAATTPETVCCALCPNPTLPAPKGIDKPEFGPLIPVHSDPDGKVHERCGDYATGVYEVSKQFWFVARALASALEYPCGLAGCKAPSPTARCAVPGCPVRYHYVCATYAGATIVEDGFKIYCPKHMDHAPHLPTEEANTTTANYPNADSDADVVDTHSVICFQCGNGGNLVLCDTCDRAVHQACAGLREIPDGEFRCSVCKGDEVDRTPTRPVVSQPEVDRTQSRSYASHLENSGGIFLPSEASDITTTPQRGTLRVSVSSPTRSTAPTQSPPRLARDASSYLVSNTQPLTATEVPVPAERTGGYDDDVSLAISSRKSIGSNGSTHEASPTSKIRSTIIAEASSDPSIEPIDSGTRIIKTQGNESEALSITDNDAVVNDVDKDEGKCSLDEIELCFVCRLVKPKESPIPCDSCDRVVHAKCAGYDHIPIDDFVCAICVEKKASLAQPSKNPICEPATEKLLPLDADEPIDVDSAEPIEIESPKPNRVKVETPKEKQPKSKTKVLPPKKRASTTSKTPPTKRRRTASANLKSPNTFKWGAWGTKRISASGSKQTGGRAQKSRKRPASQQSEAEQVQEPIWKPVLCATGLNDNQKDLLKGIASGMKTTVRKDVDSKVTHIVLSTYDDEQVPTRTIKLCKAIAAGVRLMRFEWIETAVDRREWPQPEDFLHPLTGDGKLFENTSFFFANSVDKKDDLVAIVRLGGGRVLQSMPSSSVPDHNLYFVEDSNSNTPRKGRPGGRRGSLKSVADSIEGAQVIEPSWILDKCMVRK